jgi:transcriptional regulator with XRE-family HTH domain
MTAKPDWRTRLRIVFEQSKRSKREVSLAAGLGPNYLREVLEGKSATVENLIAIAAELDTSLGHLTDEAVERLRREKARRKPRTPA